eukprot:2205920-Rhodomonas_salina.1
MRVSDKEGEAPEQRLRPGLGEAQRGGREEGLARCAEVLTKKSGVGTREKGVWGPGWRWGRRRRGR